MRGERSSSLGNHYHNSQFRGDAEACWNLLPAESGGAKSRGDSAHYQKLSRKAARARKRNAKARAAARLTKSDKSAPRNPSESARKQLTKRQP